MIPRTSGNAGGLGDPRDDWYADDDWGYHADPLPGPLELDLDETYWWPQGPDGRDEHGESGEGEPMSRLDELVQEFIDNRRPAPLSPAQVAADITYLRDRYLAACQEVDRLEALMLRGQLKTTADFNNLHRARRSRDELLTRLLDARSVPA